MLRNRQVTPEAAYLRLFSCVFFSRSHMSVTFDFQIVESNIPGISQVVAQNEDAFRYLVDEAHFTVFEDGTAALFDERVGDFISDAGHAQQCCELV